MAHSIFEWIQNYSSGIHRRRFQPGKKILTQHREIEHKLRRKTSNKLQGIHSCAS